jgi:signal transduction histidine kinase
MPGSQCAVRGRSARAHARAMAPPEAHRFMLQDILTEHHEEIVDRAKRRVAQRHTAGANEKQPVHGIPLFLRQLGDVMRDDDRNMSVLSKTAELHGNELFRAGFTVAEVVHGYGDVCQVVADIAREHDAPIQTEEFRTFNASLDTAIAHALTEHGRMRELAVVAKGTQQMGEFAHEIRNLLGNATLAFEAIVEARAAAREQDVEARAAAREQNGENGDGYQSVPDRTAEILGRSLRGMRELVSQSLNKVRLEAHVHHPRSIRVKDLVNELAVAASLEAKARGRELAPCVCPANLYVFGDRALLASAVSNLLQNALKFTHPHSTVTLRVRATNKRVFLDVEDACGGLPEGKREALFRPFEQDSADMSGIGLGLLIARKAVQVNGGVLSVRDLPGVGCVFTVEMPRHMRGAL